MKQPKHDKRPNSLLLLVKPVEGHIFLWGFGNVSNTALQYKAVFLLHGIYWKGVGSDRS